jgi:flavin reductase (DIM6/NTAB) family NADH-FMN oxidoreductase RutF
MRQAYNPATLGKFGFRSGRDFDKFQNTNFIYGENSACPIILDDSIAWFECQVENSLDIGSHIIFVGKVLDCKMINNDDEALTYDYYHKVKRGLTPKNAPSFQQK